MDERDNVTGGSVETDNIGIGQEIPEDQLCRKCGRKRIDRSENKNSILCHECREEQIKYPFPKKMLPAAVIVLALMVLAMARTPGIIRMYKMYYQAELQSYRGDVYPALLNLETVMEAYPSSVPVAVSMIDIAMEHGYYDAAAYTLSTYLEGKEVDDSTYSRMMRHTKRLNRYYDTLDQVDELYASFGEALGQEDLDGEAPIAALQGLRDDLEEMTKNADLDKGLLYYYLATLSEDEEAHREYLEASVEADPKLGFPEVELGTYRRRTGDLEGARECYESVLRNDNSNTGALRAMGILKMLEGDKEAGLADVQKAFDLNPEENYVRETLVIAMMECGQKEKAEELRQQFEAEGIEFDVDFLSYLNGEVSLHDYYVD
ncbi:hypothetical protein [Clostridium sp. AN503]|uniref:hypothetical protein n=1 Tax=Clostridium sp. AN503 TaxID=3160598 RepID=UPI0034599907